MVTCLLGFFFYISPAKQEEKNVLGLWLGLEADPALNWTSIDPVFQVFDSICGNLFHVKCGTR